MKISGKSPRITMTVAGKRCGIKIHTKHYHGARLCDVRVIPKARFLMKSVEFCEDCMEINNAQHGAL